MKKEQPQFFYSGSMRGFYVDDIHTLDQIPDDAVPITKAYWGELLDGQSLGAVIDPDTNGYPILNIPPALPVDEIVKVV